MSRRPVYRRRPVSIGKIIDGNQMVAANLRRARLDEGLTQEEAAARIGELLGAVVSKSNYSAWERSVEGKRYRDFTANQLVAFAQVFRHPVQWFFVPPIPDEDGPVPQILLDTRRGNRSQRGGRLLRFRDIQFNEEQAQEVLLRNKELLGYETGRSPYIKEARESRYAVFIRRLRRPLLALRQRLLGVLQRSGSKGRKEGDGPNRRRG